MVDQVALRGPDHVPTGTRKPFIGPLRTITRRPRLRPIKPGRFDRAEVSVSGYRADAEIKQFWRGASVLGYPFGTSFQMLLLTGQRRSEIAEARWHEIDLRSGCGRCSGKVQVGIPATSSPDRRRDRTVEKLPRWNAGDALFSTTSGQKRVNGFSYQKRSLDYS